MSKRRDPWRDGRQAWDRLARWYRDGGSPTPAAEPDPLEALSDVGLMRRLLDEAELEAVRSARRRGRSWAEIAIKLGVTRQSAWERWRDLDVESGGPDRPAEPDLAREVDPDRSMTPGSVLDRAARRQAWVTVPNVVGMSLDDARLALGRHGLVGVTADPDDLPSALLGMQQAVVTDQSPESGARARPGAPVRLWVERGGGSGVREPRRPKPTPRTARKMHEEPSEEAVG